MKRYTFTLLLSIVLLGSLTPLHAQSFLDVEPGYETLNLAVENDVSRPADRVYRLQNGGIYVLNGTVDNSGFPLHVWAADPNGMPPVLIPGVNESGSNAKSFNFLANGSLKGLYLSSLDVTGNYLRNNVQLDQDGISVTLDRCFFDYDRQAPIRCNAQEQKLYVKNCILRNLSQKGTQNTSRCIDVRENLADSIVVQNSTFFFATGELVNDQGGALFKNLIFDHNTLVATDNMDSDRIVKGRITNNLFIDVGWEIQDIAFDADDIADGDTLRDEVLPIDSLRTPLFTEAEREIYISNNSLAFSPVLVDWDNAVDTLALPVLHNEVSQSFIDTNPNIVSQNWLYEYPDFTNPPDFTKLRTYREYELSGAPEANTPDLIVDPVPNDAEDIPNTYGVTAPFYSVTGAEYIFTYPVSKASYTHAIGGFPLGDLNWFPGKKAEWEIWMTGVEQKPGHKPVEYALRQNYPNPFNPSTFIEFSLARPADVSLVVYNLRGQEIRTLVSETKSAGAYRVQWDGKDNQMKTVANGVYLYKLKAGDHTSSRLMSYVK